MRAIGDAAATLNVRHRGARGHCGFGWLDRRAPVQQEMMWVLDAPLRRRITQMTPANFFNNQAKADDRALEILEPLLTMPYADITPAWLRADPVFAPLKGNARFQRMVNGP